MLDEFELIMVQFASMCFVEIKIEKKRNQKYLKCAWGKLERQVWYFQTVTRQQLWQLFRCIWSGFFNAQIFCDLPLWKWAYQGSGFIVGW